MRPACASPRVIVKGVPEVVCTHEKLNKEFQHFFDNYSLSQKSQNKDTLYWNLLRQNPLSMFSCIVYKEDGKLPICGSAYLKYGNHIIVIQDKLDRAYFELVPDSSMKIMMEKRKVPDTPVFSYLKTAVTIGNKLVKSISYCEIANNVEWLPDSTRNQKHRYERGSNDEESDQHIEQQLPNVVCTNEGLENEIRHFLMQYHQSDGVEYWNIATHVEPYTYNGNPVFRCVISRPFNKPDYGVGYIEYDNNILIIQGEIDISLFSVVPDKDRVIPVIKNRTPWNDDCRPEVYIFFSTEQALKWHAW